MRHLSPVPSLALALMIIAMSVAVPVAAESKPPLSAFPVPGNSVLANDVAQIAALRARWLEAVNTGDVQGIFAVYGPGAVILTEGAPPMLGAGPIARWHGRWHATADVYYALEGNLLKVDGDLALEEWSARVTVTPRRGAEVAVGGDPLQFSQSGVRVYRKDARGRWRIDRETWSPDHPVVQRFADRDPATCMLWAG